MKQAPVETAISKGINARVRLRQLGLTHDGIVEVIRRGERARAEATAFDPITAPGQNAYQVRVRAMREIFVPMGFQLRRVNGLEMISSQDGTFSMITRAGDAGVGNEFADPQPKGDVGDGAALTVGSSGALLFDPKWFGPVKAERPIAQTWMLLVYAEGEIVRAELSLPISIAAKSVSGWFDRVIIDIDALGGGEDESSGSGEDDVEVSVVRKA
jgi:hypothetical protein